MDLEALAVIFSIKKLRHYLPGTQIKIIANHTALEMLKRNATNIIRAE